MTIGTNLQDNEQKKFVESPTRPNYTAVEVVIGAQEATFTTRSEYDSINNQLLYTGRAGIGALTNASSWRISRFDFSSGLLTFADGDELFDNVWDNRASLSYG